MNTPTQIKNAKHNEAHNRADGISRRLFRTVSYNHNLAKTKPQNAPAGDGCSSFQDKTNCGYDELSKEDDTFGDDIVNKNIRLNS